MKKIISIIFITVCSVSCSKFVDTKAPDSSVDASKVFEKDNSAVAAINAVLSDLGNTYSIIQGGRGVSVVNGLLSDELITVSMVPDYMEIYSNTILSSNTIPGNIWSGFYAEIYKVNAVIEGATASQTLTPAIKSQILGEAKFLRAFMYFYLVNMYGAAPLITTTNYEVNRTMARTSVDEIYKQMITDLKDADALLTPEYRNNLGAVVTQRFRPNKYAAKAMLARVYLFTGQWANAETEATAVINLPATYNLVQDINQIFRQPASAEVLWNFAPAYGAVAAGITSLFTGDGGHYNPAVLKAYGLGPQTSGYDLSNYLSDSIVNAFASNDKRKLQWLESLTVSGKTYYFPFKYKTDVFGLSTVQEYPVVMRMGEVFLIRAEARIRQEKIDDGIDDINKVRFRSNIADTSATTKAAAMGVLEREKRLELFTEWGHRWFDLKRWPGKDNPAISRAEEVMSVITPLKGGTWDKDWLLLPLPQTDIINNPFLKQNDGYQ